MGKKQLQIFIFWFFSALPYCFLSFLCCNFTPVRHDHIVLNLQILIATIFFFSTANIYFILNSLLFSSFVPFLFFSLQLVKHLKSKYTEYKQKHIHHHHHHHHDKTQSHAGFHEKNTFYLRV